MTGVAGARERLRFLADVVEREALYLRETDGRLLEAQLEPVGTVLDKLNRAERLGWARSASEWAELGLLRNRMVHEYVREPQDLVDALHAAHAGVADLVTAALTMSARARSLPAGE